MLKNRSHFVPGGFQWTQPETGWQADAGQSFDEVVKSIIAHRKANPRFNLPTDVATVANELDNANSRRLEGNPMTASFVMPGAPPSPAPFRNPRNAVSAGVAGVKKYAQNTVAGIGLYLEWMGENPVKQEQAVKRAEVCLSCPIHKDGDIFQSFNEESAKQIMTVLGLMSDLKMTTPLDSKLKICDACDCPMRAKIWPRLEVIKKHLRPEAKAKLWANCWILKEE